MPKKFKVTGSIYEPSCDGADRDGYLRFWDVIEAEDALEAVELAKEDYGDYMAVEHEGEVKSNDDEKKWLARNVT